MNFTQAIVIKSNITSSLTQAYDYMYFAVLTRQLSTKSSQWIYRVDLYDRVRMILLDSIEVYQTYNVNKHYLKMIPSRSAPVIAVAMDYYLQFYSISPLRLINQFLHQQPNIYDLSVSSDGQLTALVGQQILFYKNNDYQKIILNEQIESARYCQFSKDNRYLAIASTGSIYVYTYVKANGLYLFNREQLTQAPVQYGSITSIKFNPLNSSEIIVGFLDTSPLAYSIQNGVYFKKFNDIQPQSTQNAKSVKYMPDGVRLYSSDNSLGIGVWPGSNGVLFYKESYLLYDLQANADGTALLGAVWQNIKLVNIQVNCSNNNYGDSALTCNCASGFRWDFGTYSCQPLNCNKNLITSSTVLNNSCPCLLGYTYSSLYGQCVINCASLANTLTINLDANTCICISNYSWNSVSKTCSFDCTIVAYSTGIATSSNACACLPTFIWNSVTNQCACPSYMTVLNAICVCIDNFYVNQTGPCIANCSAITRANSATTTNLQTCTCESNYYFTIKDNIPGCQLNCTNVKDTIFQNANFESCICHQHMTWNGVGCDVACATIAYADVTPLANNTCSCAVNYLWIDRIKQCGRVCTGQPYTIPNADSTLIACPCIDKFHWNTASQRCEIDCSSVTNTNKWSLGAVDKCDCREGFNWDASTFNCVVDCTKIWNGDQRINSSYCSCLNSLTFNSTSLICYSASSTSIFDSKVSIAILVLAIIAGITFIMYIVVVILIVLARFCWQFKTESNKEHQKKIKTKDNKPKKNKKHQENQLQPQFQMKTNQRLNSPEKKITTKTTI